MSLEAALKSIHLEFIMALHSTTDIEMTTHTQNPSAATLADVELLPHEAGARSEDHQTHSLPPTDGGKDAWLFLFSCFMLEAMIWGECKTYWHLNITDMNQAFHQHMVPVCHLYFEIYVRSHNRFLGLSRLSFFWFYESLPKPRVFAALLCFCQDFHKSLCQR